MTMPGRVFLVDDQPALRKAMARLLTLENFVVVTFASAQEFVDSGNLSAMGCLILDLSMPDMSGMELYQMLLDKKCSLPVIFLTGHGSIETGVKAMKLGAADFLTKPVQKEELLSAIRSAFEKNRLSHEAGLKRDEFNQRLASLTPRERDVLHQIITGRLNKQIAADLGTVEQTVKIHRARVMMKMKVHSLAELVKTVEEFKSA
jgi:FixJ family two-component response regulator